jgi:MFS family permease
MAASGRRCAHAASPRRGVCLERISYSIKQDIRLVNFGCYLGVFVGDSGVGLCRLYRRALDAPSWSKDRGITAGVCYGLGVALSSFSSGNIWILWLSYGVLGGFGIGLGYIVPLATLVKWFPDRRGFITGLAVAGFGAGALVTAPVAQQLIARFGPLTTLAILGICYLIMVVLGASIMRNPPEGWRPAGWQLRLSNRSNWRLAITL